MLYYRHAQVCSRTWRSYGLAFQFTDATRTNQETESSIDDEKRPNNRTAQGLVEDSKNTTTLASRRFTALKIYPHDEIESSLRALPRTGTDLSSMERDMEGATTAQAEPISEGSSSMSAAPTLQPPETPHRSRFQQKLRTVLTECTSDKLYSPDSYRFPWFGRKVAMIIAWLIALATTTLVFTSFFKVIEVMLNNGVTTLSWFWTVQYYLLGVVLVNDLEPLGRASRWHSPVALYIVGVVFDLAFLTMWIYIIIYHLDRQLSELQDAVLSGIWLVLSAGVLI
jgi:hypothetical protein